MKNPLLLSAAIAAVSACQPTAPDQVVAPQPLVPPPTVTAPQPPTTAAPVAPAPAPMTPDEFNRRAVRLNLPIFWADTNGNTSPDPAEIKALLFYPSETKWTEGGAFTPAFKEAHARILAAEKDTKDLPAAEAERRRLVREDLVQGEPTLVYNDLTGLSAEEKTLVRHIAAASKLVDSLYAAQRGIGPLHAQVPADDAASQSLFRRNWGPKCIGPKTDKNPACSAIPGAPKAAVGIYPASIQKDPKFCETLEKHPDAKKLLDPFVVVQEKDGKLAPVPYTEAYKDTMAAVAVELRAAAADIKDPKEAPLKAYLTAAARSFTDNKWQPADEAWAKMNAQNSRFYLRIGPDETYWEPCSQKAGFHVSFARINLDSLEWQKKLVPVQQEMEKSLADLIGAPYKARKVTFDLPDFIDIIWNSGDDRQPMGWTAGQSLPNWGPVANQGRGRTMVMSNINTDPDGLKRRRQQAESLLTKESMASYADSVAPGLLSIILHEAAHNLGPSHEYKYKGKKDTDAFGGGLSAMLEELKAQSGALYYVEFVKKRGLISPTLAQQTYVDSLVWGFGQIAQGLYTASGARKAYGQLAAIHLGFFMDEGAVTFDQAAIAANGADKGAFVIHLDKLPAAADKLMKTVATIKATGDKAAAEALAKRYVDGDFVPVKLVTERALRFPKGSLVYALDL